MSKLFIIAFVTVFIFGCTCEVDTTEITEAEKKSNYLVLPDGDTIFGQNPEAKIYMVEQDGDYKVFEAVGEPEEKMEIVGEDTIWVFDFGEKTYLN